MDSQETNFFYIEYRQSFIFQLKVLNVDNIHLEEECTIDTKRRTMHVVSRSMTWTQYACAKEQSVFKPHGNNKNW